ncbi:MAG: hypothetical protein JXX29_14935, partial [Deltaproteobacteria bacterium]|nr:hypothetical protein [Deltaproteobacteria bacterium]MBN2672975.1 hypothetical protein [Deltaproteobacteria bacterium]
VATTPEYYYLTDESLDTINLFNEEQFHKIYKGKSRPNRDRSVTTEALGKLKKNNGTSEIITTESIGLQVLNSEGVEVGKIVEEYEFDPRYNEEEE